MDLELENRTAIVAASSRGLGFATARRLVEEGANVVVNGRDESTLQEAASELDRAGPGDVRAQQADLEVAADVEALVDAAVDEFGGLDHLVTNAGGPPGKTFAETTDDDWYKWFDQLVMSVVRLVRASTDHLAAGGGGSIVNITSISAKEAGATSALVLSNAIRMAVLGLEKTLSRQLAPDVRINAVLPGTYETDRFVELNQRRVAAGEVRTYAEGVAEWKAELGVATALDRLGEPEELADVVAFLLSERASYLTGATLLVDGGASRSTI